jgi:uncharacterized delta-60 repeat protein
MNLFVRVAVAAVFTFVLSHASAQSTYAPLSPDPTWGKGGVATLGVPDQGNFVPFQTRVQPDGKPLVLILTRSTASLVRFNTDGSVDNTFGDRGELTLPGFGQLTDVPDRDGAYLYATSVGSRTLRLSRITRDGKLDTTFGNSKGYVDLRDPISVFTTALFPTEDGAWFGLFVNAQSGGDSNVGVVRLTQRGALDTQFAPEGVRIYPTPDSLKGFRWDPSNGGLVRAPDGTLTLLWVNPAGAGAPPYGYVLTRFDKSGNPDTAFGGDGVLTGAEIRNASDRATRVVALDNNSLQLTDFDSGSENTAWRVVGGKLDTSLGEGGIVRDFSVFGACGNHVLFADALNYVVTPDYADSLQGSAQTVTLCRNAKPVAAPITPAKNAVGNTPRFLMGTLEGLRRGSAQSGSNAGFYLIGSIGGGTLCTRTCVNDGQSIYLTKVTADGRIDSTFGSGKGYVEWVSATPVLSTESSDDLIIRPNGSVVISGISRITKELIAPGSSTGLPYVLHALSSAGQIDETFAPGGRLRLTEGCCGQYSIVGSATVWRSDGLGAALTPQGARVVQANPPKVGAPWVETIAQLSPRSDGLNWVRTAALDYRPGPDGLVAAVYSQQIALVDGDGKNVPDGVAGQPAVFFPLDGSAPGEIATLPDDGLLLVSTTGDRPITLTRWDRSGRFDPMWASGGVLQVSVTPKDAKVLSVRYNEVKAFALPSGDLWVFVPYLYTVDPKVPYSEGGFALLYVSDSGRTISRFEAPKTNRPPKLRPDGRIAFIAQYLNTKKFSEIISIDKQGNATSDIPTAEFVPNFAYQADGKLIVASGNAVTRYLTQGAAAPAPTARNVTEFYNVNLNQ